MPEIPHAVEIWIFVALAVMVILFLISGMARIYRKAGPHEALIVYGLGGTRVVKGRGTVNVKVVNGAGQPVTTSAFVSWAGEGVSTVIPLACSSWLSCLATPAGFAEAFPFGSRNRSNDDRYSGFRSICADSRAFWDSSRECKSSCRWTV